MKNKTLYDTLLSVHDLADLRPKELLHYTKLIRNIAASPSGPFGIGVFNGTDLYTLNAHLQGLYGKYGKQLPGTMAFTKQRASLSTMEPPHQAPPSLAGKALQDACYAGLEEWSASCASAVRPLIQKTFKKVRSIDATGEISLLSFYFGSQLANKAQGAVYTQLGTANLLVWMAYTLYDALVDTPETPAAANGLSLAAANHCARQALLLYKEAFPASTLPERLLSETDAALAKEAALRQSLQKAKEHHPLQRSTHKQLLSAKSIAHGIGPLLLIEALQPNDLPYAEKALRAYCAARQLNDDLHDWQEDLIAGQHQYVIARLLRDAHAAGITVPANVPLSPATLKQLQSLFWERTLCDLLDEQRRMLQTARRLLMRIGIAPKSDFFTITLDPIATALHAVQKRNQFEKEFVKLFKIP